MSRVREFNEYYVAAMEGVEILPVRTTISQFDLPFGVQIEFEMDAVKQDDAPKT